MGFIERLHRHNGLGQPNRYLASHPVYLSIGRDDTERRAAYRDLFRAHLDEKAIDGIRLALNQNQPLGDSRFYASIEAAIGQKREARPRGRPRKERHHTTHISGDQGELEL